MSEVKFKFVYNGGDSFVKLVQELKKDGIRLDKIGKKWNGWIRMEDKKIFVDDEYFICVCCEIKHILEDKKNIPVEIDLTSNSF